MSAFFLVCGILIGWVTKIPFMLKWYKEMAKKKRDIDKVEHLLPIAERLIDAGDESPLLKMVKSGEARKLERREIKPEWCNLGGLLPRTPLSPFLAYWRTKGQEFSKN